MDGRLFLAIVTAMCLALFFNGRRFARMNKNPLSGKTLFGMPIEGAEMSVDQVRRIGRLQMIAAPLFWLLFSAMCFGLLGPVDGIQTIQFN